ncbi:MAG TPA: 4-(cytidine 5'-diphospho)-2-C-methyl-D-erythritol kinase [Bryobacteraceae bacterium]|nr:4-(cytidine 5'-diphospho)-2-C-methyl-D-erythritol kinase [Bryobacteraceae bacterium]
MSQARGKAVRHARVRALAKLNLDLRVLGKRSDGYHELRTIFQTISLGDTLDIAFTPGRKTSIELRDPLAIPDNLVVRAACLALESMGAAGRVEITLAKRIPMGAGLGGGSSDAAAVLLALPALAGKKLALAEMCRLGQQLGSDVPFFLLGGTAVGIGRGTEVFPLPDGPARWGVLVAPDVHVSTAQAYRDLGPHLTMELQENKIFTFQCQSWAAPGSGAAENDFETVVLEQQGRLAALKRRLTRAGARPALMTGSGSALFGLFAEREQADRALEAFRDERVFPISLVSRARYRSMWWRALGAHMERRLWPPQSRYVR